MRRDGPRNPHFGLWRGDGDTARPKHANMRGGLREQDPPVECRHCPLCGARVTWDTDRHGATLALDRDGRVHVCALDSVLEKQAHEPGPWVMEALRRAMNERRMYGEAV